jgi:hypothetical protein
MRPKTRKAVSPKPNKFKSSTGKLNITFNRAFDKKNKPNENVQTEENLLKKSILKQITYKPFSRRKITNKPDKRKTPTSTVPRKDTGTTSNSSRASTTAFPWTWTILRSL